MFIEVEQSTRHPEAGPWHWCTKMYTTDFTHHYWNSTKDPKCVHFQITILLHFFNISSIYFRLFLIISPWKRAGSFRSFEQTWIPFVQWCCVSSLVDIGPLVLEESITISSMYFCYYLIISPWERTGLFIRKKKSWIPFIQECCMPSLDDIVPAVL